MFKSCLCLVLSLTIAIWQATNASAKLVVFGDSLSEAGNFFAATLGTLPPSPLYFNGRFSNGPAWIEHLAIALDEEVPLPSLMGGTNLAFNGSRASGASPYGTPDVATQVDQFLTAVGGVASADDVFVFWAGANDIFFGALAGETSFVPNAIGSISAAIRKLHNAGARNFVVLDLPLLGQTPFFNTNPTLSTQLNSVTNSFNSALASELRQLRRNLARVRIADVKISRLFQLITRAPRLFQLRDVKNSATVFDPESGIGSAIRPNVRPDEYLFWDSVHPTAQGHKIIARYAQLELRLQCR